MQKIDLTAAMEFALNRVADDPLVVAAYDCFDRKPVGRRCLDRRHILRTDQREIKRSRNRSSRERQNVYQLESLFQQLLVTYSEPLFLIYDKQPEILELDVGRNESVRANDDVNGAIMDRRYRVPLFRDGKKSAQHSHPNRIVGHSLSKGFKMLLSEARSGHQHRSLFSAHARFKRR